MKALTEPQPIKRVSWTSDAPIKRGLSKSFETTSKICIIDNAWNANNEHIKALEDRGRLFLFQPPPFELHVEMEHQEWFTDEEVYNFVGENIKTFKDLSARLYVKAAEAKAAGEDWRAFVLEGIHEADREIMLLEYDPLWKDKTTNEKAREFSRRTGLTARGSYFNRRKTLWNETLPGHRLAGKFATTPDDPPGPEAGADPE